jgi:CDP-diglyceride synthetase
MNKFKLALFLLTCLIIQVSAFNLRQRPWKVGTLRSHLATTKLTNQIKMSATSDLGKEQLGASSISNNAPDATNKPSFSSKLIKRWQTGLSLGLIGTLWIASGNGFFMLGFLLMSQLCQSEYYNMVRAVGVLPAEKTGLLSSLMCHVTAAMFPQYHELVMPISATMLVLWLLIFNKKSASISEISTSLLGMFYIGYLPSFWVRLRALNNNAYFAVPVVLSNWNPFLPEALTQGSLITWWTWFSIVVADVTAYFVGKKYGKHKLSTVSSAAGSASPNKTVEGALGGFLGCTALSILGGYLMKWPYWQFLGLSYGLILSFIALVGDLTASMMKRDARLKDTGNLFPGHGGLLDRFDSYMFTAPIAYFFYHDILPYAMRLSCRR